MRECRRCGEEKPESDFYFNRSQNRHHSWCKACVNKNANGPGQKKRIRFNLYGLTDEGYNRRFEKQGGVCAICGKPETAKTRSGAVKPLCVDHDHDTGEVRGLLCHTCNIGLGGFRDSPELLTKAADYLKTNYDVTPIEYAARRYEDSLDDVELLIAEWARCFPDEPAPSRAIVSHWLEAAGTYDLVVDAFERGKSKGSTADRLRGYVKAICEDKQGFRAANKQKQGEVIPFKTASEGEKMKAFGNTSGWAIRPPTQEELDDDAEAKRILIERGVWNPDAY